MQVVRVSTFLAQEKSLTFISNIVLHTIIDLSGLNANGKGFFSQFLHHFVRIGTFSALQIESIVGIVNHWRLALDERVLLQAIGDSSQKSSINQEISCATLDTRLNIIFILETIQNQSFYALVILQQISFIALQTLSMSPLEVAVVLYTVRDICLNTLSRLQTADPVASNALVAILVEQSAVEFDWPRKTLIESGCGNEPFLAFVTRHDVIVF